MDRAQISRPAGPRVFVFWLTLLCQAWFWITPGSSAADGEVADLGIIAGQLFTARHPDSVAVNADLTLIYRDGAGELNRVLGKTGREGEYRFDGVAVDPTIQYVVKVDFFGREYLGSPMAFEPNSSLLEFNFLVARDAQPLDPPTAGDAHADDPRFGQPLQEDPFATLSIVGFFLALFALPVYRIYAKDREKQFQGQVGERRLVRDIASLDLRFDAGELPEPEYRSIRDQLFARLQSESAAPLKA